MHRLAFCRNQACCVHLHDSPEKHWQLHDLLSSIPANTFTQSRDHGKQGAHAECTKIAHLYALAIFTRVSQGILQCESVLSQLIAEKIAVATIFHRKEVAHLGALKFRGSRAKLRESPGKIAGKTFPNRKMQQILGFWAPGKVNLPGTLGRHCLDLVPTFRAGCFLKSTVPAFCRSALCKALI